MVLTLLDILTNRTYFVHYYWIIFQQIGELSSRIYRHGSLPLSLSIRINQKKIPARLLEKITVDREYNIELHICVTVEDFNGIAASAS